MKSFHLSAFAGVLSLMIPAWGQSQDAVAVITELKLNRGEIQIRSAANKAPERPAVLQSLYPGNLVHATQDAVAVVLFTEGMRTVRVEEKNSPFEIKAFEAKESQAGSLIKDVTRLLLGKKKPPSYVALSVRGKTQPPTLLSPRSTKVMTDAPTLQWMGMDRQPGTVKVFGPEGLVWSAENIALTQIAYPASAPRLRRGVEYSWTIEKKGFPPQKALFTLLTPGGVSAIQEKMASLSTASGISKTTLAVLKANVLMSHELFHEAREVLLEGIVADPDEPTLHFVLGELYEKIGLKNLAADEHGEAEFLSKSKR